MNFLIFGLMNTFEHVKEKKALEIRFQRMVHELESITSQNSHTSSLHWRYELDLYLRDAKIVGDYQNGDDNFYRVITLANPTIKHQAEYNDMTYWEYIKDCDDWTWIVQYFKIDHYVHRAHIGPKEVEEMLGIEPVDAVFMKNNHSELCKEELEWLRWIGTRNSPNNMTEWKDDWYIFDRLYLPLIGQMFDAYLRPLARRK